MKSLFFKIDATKEHIGPVEIELAGKQIGEELAANGSIRVAVTDINEDCSRNLLAAITTYVTQNAKAKVGKTAVSGIRCMFDESFTSYIKFFY